MLKKLILENWKSFRYAELPIDPLTVLIGTNASGKSNAIEALEFLSRISQGEIIQTALIGDSKLPSIRGGADWATLKPATKFTLTTLLQGTVESIDYLYSITIKAIPFVYSPCESLEQNSHHSESSEQSKLTSLFRANTDDDVDEETAIYIYKKEDPVVFASSEFQSSLYQLTSPLATLLDEIEGEVDEGISTVQKTLRNIFILNPVPSNMRSYSRLSSEIASDASNIAGFLAALPEARKAYVELSLSSYISHLPERDIQRVWAETVGRTGSDAMLYCEESWALDEPPMVIDARGISDGTLRFLAIVTALLTRPEGSQLVIEEVDNGLHPSRAELLLKMLKELGTKRKIDILVTTHNPALLNALQPEMIPFVVVAHRDAQTGESKLTPLDDIQRLPKLLASGHIGDLATQGAIEKSLSQ